MLIIDAQILAAYFRETVLDLPPILTAATSAVFALLSDEIPADVDEGGKVEHEWKSVVEPEWFSAWFASLVRDGKIQFRKTRPEREVIKRLRLRGFPATRDVWYVRVACAVRADQGSAILVSEDMDFF